MQDFSQSMRISMELRGFAKSTQKVLKKLSSAYVNSAYCAIKFYKVASEMLTKSALHLKYLKAQME